MAGAPLFVREQQSQVVRDGFINPLIAIGTPTHNVAPPLVSHFMKGHEFRELFLGVFRNSRALLRRRRQERERRKIQKPWPSLAKGSWNLRNAQLLERKRSAERFVKVNRRIDFSCQLLQCIRRAGCDWNDRRHSQWILSFRAERAGHPRSVKRWGAKASPERLL